MRPSRGGQVVATALLNAAPGPLALSGTVYPLAAGTIPFPFVFNGASYTGFYLASGGYLTFGSSAPHTFLDFRPDGLPYDIFHPLSQYIGADFDGVISVMGGDVLANTTGQLGEIRYQTLGVAPARTFVMQWARMRSYRTVSELNFQIRLHETSNAIEFAYGVG